MDNISLLAAKYGACLTLEQAAPFFGCKSAKALLEMYNRGQCPIPITTLRRPNSKQNPRVVLTEHFGRYLDEMGQVAQGQFQEDMEKFGIIPSGSRRRERRQQPV